jgi:hypothetical protein
MTDEFANLIAEYPEASPETLKRIFIRNQGTKAYVESKLSETSEVILSEIALLGTIGAMSNDDEIRDHLTNLEKCRAYLSCYIQGIRRGQEDKLAPEFKEKHEKEKIAKQIRKSTKDEGVAKLVAALMSAKSITIDDKPVSLKKETCGKCNTEVFSLKFHKC